MSKHKVYIVHGWTYDTFRWEKSLEIMRSHDIEPIMLNVPGLTEPSDEVWTIDGYVEWLHGQLKSSKNPIVIAHSNGGRISLNYDLKYPGHLKQLILVDSAGVEAKPTQKNLKRKVVYALAVVLAPIKYIPYAKKVVYKLLGAQDYNNAPPNMKQTLANMISSDRELDVRNVAVPVDIIWGSEDFWTPVEQATLLHKSLKNSRSLEFVDGARHSPYYTHPEEFVRLVIRALEA